VTLSDAVATANAAEPTGRSTNPWVVLVLVCMAQFMVVLDSTIVNVALPAIQRDLHFTVNSLQWVVNSYTLVLGGFLLLGGRAGDLFGRKRLFLIGVAIFTVASLMNALGTTAGMLIVFRGLQGFGAALISPIALSIVTTTFTDGRERAKALAVWAAIAVGGASIGLVLGGALTEYLNWRWNFFINIPVGIAVIFVSWRLLPTMAPDRSMRGRGFDLGGAATVTAGLMAVVYGIVNANQYGWTDVRTTGFLAAGALLLVVFVVIESRVKDPLVRLSIFRVRTLRAADVTMLIVAGGMFSVFFFASLYVQEVLGFSPLRAGLGFLPLTAAIIISANVAQRVVGPLGIKMTGLIGMVVAAIGLGLMATIQVGGSYWTQVFPGLVVMGFGLGLTFMPLTMLATYGTTSEDAGLASGLLNASQQVGGALGLAILSTLAAHMTTSQIAGLGHAPTPHDLASASTSGYRAAFIAAAGLMLLGTVLLSLLISAREARVDQASVPAAVAVDG
jgi:EmrB/QacA subfamily drug resistance transporter